MQYVYIHIYIYTLYIRINFVRMYIKYTCMYTYSRDERLEGQQLTAWRAAWGARLIVH